MEPSMTKGGIGRSTRPGELRLRSARLELGVLPEVGCHWTRLLASVKGDWVDLLDPVPADLPLAQVPRGHGSFIMAPWSNRVANAAFEFDGKRFPLRESFRDGTAIHGDVRTRPWKVAASSEEKLEASLDSRDFPDFNYPFALKVTHSLELSGDRLRCELLLENVDRSRAPVGFGFHPYLRRRLTERDRDVILIVPAEKVYPAERCLPTGPPVPVSGALDLRRLERLGAPNLDHCYTGLLEETIRVIYPETGLEARFRMDPVFTHTVVFAPNGDDGTAKGFIAVEPVTNANDGFNLLARGREGTGVRVLEPGESWGGGWELSVGDI